MRTESQLLESIQRFQSSFWNKEAAERPLVGVYDERVYMPINFLRQPFTRATVKRRVASCALGTLRAQG